MSNKDKLNIDTLCKEAHKNAKTKGFYEDIELIQSTYEINSNEYKMFLNNALATRLMLINCEVAEAVEGLRKNDMENFKEEIADIFIRLGDLCGSLNINIEEEIIKSIGREKFDMMKEIFSSSWFK